MFGKFPGLVLGLLDTCEIYHFRNAPPGHSFSGCLFPSFYSLFSSHLGVTLVPDSVFYLWFLSVVPESSFCLLFLSLVSESGFSVLFLSLIHKLYLVCSIDSLVYDQGERDKDFFYRTWKRREATIIGLFDEPKEPCTGARRTETCVAPRHVDVLRGALLTIC